MKWEQEVLKLMKEKKKGMTKYRIQHTLFQKRVSISLSSVSRLLTKLRKEKKVGLYMNKYWQVTQ
jgi:Fe2+ or Zn2+ uptake regulation protein